MKRFIEGLDRGQTTLLAECIDDYVDEDNPVRAIDAFVDLLDLGGLGFHVEPEATGRPGYHPATLLKLYVYGYLNQVQSSRKLDVNFQEVVHSILTRSADVAIDESKFKAVNAKAKSYTRDKLRRRLGKIDAAIDRYMGELDRTDEAIQLHRASIASWASPPRCQTRTTGPTPEHRLLPGPRHRPRPFKLSAIIGTIGASTRRAASYSRYANRR